MNTAMNNDVYFKKIIEFHAWKQRLEFKVSQDLFSSFDIDQGTKFLLRSIVEANYQKPETILDLGCGYGPIGLTLKSMFKDCTVHMVDIDALAVEYSRQNAKLNGLSGPISPPPPPRKLNVLPSDSCREGGSVQIGKPDLSQEGMPTTL